MRELNAIVAIAYRDILKFLRDRTRLAATFVFPIVIIAGLGGSLQANLGSHLHFNFLSFVFTGIYVQTLFQSASFGIISLIEDRENDFSQEIFVSPVSRYSIIFGKIVGESGVALLQGVVITLFGVVLGVSMTVPQLLSLIPTGIAACLLGGAFGVILLGNIHSQRAANQIFPFIFFPQFFLAGVFNPIQHLPLYLEVLSLLSPLRYVVDFTRSLFYAGTASYGQVVLESPLLNLAVIAGMFVLFIALGTTLFVRQERNR